MGENMNAKNPVIGNHKTTYVLVHGAWHGSWCWKHIRAALQSAGHSVFTPTLTGLGESSHLNSAAIDLSTHIADIVNLIKWEELSDVLVRAGKEAGLGDPVAHPCASEVGFSAATAACTKAGRITRACCVKKSCRLIRNAERASSKT
jgi:alpha-beta hydrolase superfamily lysophospholipase